MKNKYILFSLVGIMITSNHMFAMHSIQPALPNNFYAESAHNYVIAHKDHPHFKDNLKQKEDWLMQKLYTHKKKCLTLRVMKKNGKTYSIQGLNPLPNLQDYLIKITQTAKKNNDLSLENLFSSYLHHLNHIWKNALFMHLKSYCGEVNPNLENLGLSQISEHIFKNTLMIWGTFNDIDTIYAIEALHFTKACLEVLNNETISNQNID